MKKTKMLAIAFAAIAWTGLADAQMAQPQNVLTLSAQGTVEVAQDLMSISLTASRDGSDAAAVQGQLKSVLDAALAEAKRSAQPGQMDVRTGYFNVSPRYVTNGNGRIDGWRGTVELVLSGRDFPRIAQVAGRMPGMTVSNISFGLSREQRAKVEGDAQQEAIDRFKSKAQELARGFGFSGYTLREVNVNSNDYSPGPRPVMMAKSASSISESAPVPVEAGKAAVTVNVSGSVQLR